ncbi:MAG: DJ-1 family glyoxalase III [Clostridium sp.]|uniref:DJ-1 family glyoxalase III n=1 Tax=Clostridium sp. TaxID=1506 RepID=UPI003F2C0A5D
MKKIGVLLSNGFEEIEALTVVDVLRRANVECLMIGTSGLEITGAHNIKVVCDKALTEEVKAFDGIVLPGGMPGSKNLRDNDKVIELVKYMNKEEKLVSAICAAPIVLEKAKIIEGRKITSYPNSLEDEKKVKYLEENVVIDKNILTSRGPSTALEFSYEILRYLGLTKEAENLEKGMLFKK